MLDDETQLEVVFRKFAKPASENTDIGTFANLRKVTNNSISASTRGKGDGINARQRLRDKVFSLLPMRRALLLALFDDAEQQLLASVLQQSLAAGTMAIRSCSVTRRDVLVDRRVPTRPEFLRRVRPTAEAKRAMWAGRVQ
jgi:hypothetical protein